MPGAGMRPVITTPEMDETPLPRISWLQAYRLRWKRRRLLWRSFRSRHQLRAVRSLTQQIAPEDVLAFVVLRNEASRLPFFLEHYRKLGVAQFLIVDNGSTDGSAELLLAEPDVSLWQTQASYRQSRFGLDWVSWLLMRYGRGHWCLTVDADELLVYPGQAQMDLPALTRRLDQEGRVAFGALMLELYPKGALGQGAYRPGQDPLEVLPYFDTDTYRSQRQSPMGNLWLQGGPRERVFFADEPERAPTLNKLPLIKWNARYAYVNSTHAALPRRLNAAYAGPGDAAPSGWASGGASGVLLHTKFLPEILAKSAEERIRGEHFHDPRLFDPYYAEIEAAPELYWSGAARYESPEQLAELGLCVPILSAKRSGR